jgi:hypothetical protein
MPSSVRQEYWAEFERMKSALARQRPSQSLEECMGQPPDILSVEEMKQRYGSFYDQSPTPHLDRRKVPERFWPLLPYAEFWGLADDGTREILVRQAHPNAVRDGSL